MDGSTSAFQHWRKVSLVKELDAYVVAFDSDVSRENCRTGVGGSYLVDVARDEYIESSLNQINALNAKAFRRLCSRARVW